MPGQTELRLTKKGWYFCK